MGELDDALAGLRTEALAAAGTDWERVRAARRRYLARRATAAALAVAVVVGGGAIAFAGSGFLQADKGEHLLVTPTDSPAAEPTSDPSSLGSLERQPFKSSALAWDPTSAELLVLGSRCLDYDCLVELRAYDNPTSSTTTSISRGLIDPEGNDTADSHIAGDLAVAGGRVFAFGPSLYERVDQRWVEQPVDGIVSQLVSGPGGEVVAAITRCEDYPRATGCSLEFRDLSSGHFDRLGRYTGLRPTEYVAEIAGTRDQLLVVLADNQVTRQLRGDIAHLAAGGNPCVGWNNAAVVAQGSTFLELCTGSDQPDQHRFFRSTDAGVSWEPITGPAIGSDFARLAWPGCAAHPSTVLAMPHGRLQVSTDSGASWRQISNADVDPGSEGRALGTCAGDKLAVLVDKGDGSALSLWTSTNGTSWSHLRLE